ARSQERRREGQRGRAGLEAITGGPEPAQCRMGQPAGGGSARLEGHERDLRAGRVRRLAQGRGAYEGRELGRAPAPGFRRDRPGRHAPGDDLRGSGGCGTGLHGQLRHRHGGRGTLPDSNLLPGHLPALPPGGTDVSWIPGPRAGRLLGLRPPPALGLIAPGRLPDAVGTGYNRAMAMDAYELTLAAPGRNALGAAVMEDIRSRLHAAAGRPVLLAGSGGAFSAGLNLKEVAALDRDGMARFLDLLETLIEELYCYPGPVVAAITGHAIAGGCVLALCCDHRVIVD